MCVIFSALGEDFEVVENNVTISDNFTSGVISFSVDIISDDLVEGDHSFIVRIIDDGSFTVGSISEAKVIIIDDDSELKVQ